MCYQPNEAASLAVEGHSPANGAGNPVALLADLVDWASAQGARGREAVKQGYEAAVRTASRLLEKTGRNHGYDGRDTVHDLVVLDAERKVAAKLDQKRGSLAGLRYGALKNLVRRHLRNPFQRRRISLTEEPADPASTPAEQAEAADTRERLLDAMARLPEQERREVERRIPQLAASASAGTVPPPDDKDRSNYVKRTRLWQSAMRRLRHMLAGFDARFR